MMATTTQHLVDKSSWGYGPWTDEPDRGDWKEQGFECSVRRMSRSGHLCGYVGVPKGHPWFGADYNLLYDECSVHGGLTFSERLPDANPDLWWVGFDCAHGADLTPGQGQGFDFMYFGGFLFGSAPVYRDWAFVEAELSELVAAAVRAAENPWPKPTPVEQAFLNMDEDTLQAEVLARGDVDAEYINEEGREAQLAHLLGKTVYQTRKLLFTASL